jgi:hypothetical protein
VAQKLSINKTVAKNQPEIKTLLKASISSPQSYLKRVKDDLFLRSSNSAGSMNRAQTVQVIIPNSTTEAMDLIP